MLPDLEPADRIGEFWSEDRTLRAVLVGMLPTS
jgi:hypothetical protein